MLLIYTEEAEDIEGHSEDASVESDRDGPLALVTRPAQVGTISSACTGGNH